MSILTKVIIKMLKLNNDDNKFLLLKHIKNFVKKFYYKTDFKRSGW